MKTKKVLLIYEDVPETTTLFLLPHDCKHLDTLRACHGKYINGADEDAALKDLVKIMYGEDGISEKSELNKWKLKAGDKPYLLRDSHIEEIIVTGMYL